MVLICGRKKSIQTCQDIKYQTLSLLFKHKPESFNSVQNSKITLWSDLPMKILTDKQKHFFENEGFLVIENFVSHEACDTLRKRAEDLVDSFDPKGLYSVWSTYTDFRQSIESERYLLASGAKTSFFFEQDAFDAEGNLLKEKHLAINKIGHAVHDLDPVFSSFSRTPELAALASDEGFSQPLLFHSGYIFKQPQIGGEVVMHQDATFLYTDPVTVVGHWFAMEDATVDNGCLWVIPGTHRSPLRIRFVRESETDCHFETYDSAPWLKEQGGIPLEVKKGALISFKGLLVHGSAPNKSDKSRHAYTLHLIDASANLPSQTWVHRPPDMPFRGFDL